MIGSSPLRCPAAALLLGWWHDPAKVRASKLDESLAILDVDELGTVIVPPEEIRRRVNLIGRADNFDVVVVGNSDPRESDLPRTYQSAGAIWWLECIHDLRGPLDEMLDRVRAGP